MSSHNVQINILLLPQGTRDWVAWCPQVDVVTSGINPENAVGMTIEALRITFEGDLCSFFWVDERTRLPKKVLHPLRRGRNHAISSDESWPTYEDYVMHRGVWRRQTPVRLSELIPAISASIVVGSVSVEARGGIVSVHPSFSDWAVVPARTFDYKASTTPREIPRVASVPAAFLEPDAPLRRSGLSEEGVVLAWIDQHGPDPADQVIDWSVRERPPAEDSA